MVANNLLGRQAQPLRNTDITEDRTLQNLKIDKILIACVLKVMRIRHRHIPDIASLEVESTTAFRRREDCQPRLALDEEGPLVALLAVGDVPVELAHGTGLDGEEGGGEVLGDGEGQGVEDLDAAAGDGVGVLLREVVAVGAGEGDRTGGPGDVLLRDVLGRGRAVEDVKFAFGDLVEG